MELRFVYSVFEKEINKDLNPMRALTNGLNYTNTSTPELETLTDLCFSPLRLLASHI